MDRNAGLSRGARLRSLGRLSAWVFAAGIVAAFTAAPASASLTELASGPGKILDASPDRVIFFEDGSPAVLKVYDVGTDASTPIPVPVGREPVDEAALINGGVLFASREGESGPYRLEEWRDGVLTNLGQGARSGFWGDLIHTAGDYAVWSGGGSLYRYKVSSRETTVVSTAAGGGYDVDEQGDVVFASSTDNKIYRWSTGLTGLVSQRPPSDPSYAPLTDGANTLYAAGTGLNMGTDIVLNDGASETVLDSDDEYSQRPGRNYALENGWVAYTRVERTGTIHPDLTPTVWIRNPSGVSERLSPSPTHLAAALISGLNPGGQVVYTHLGNTYIATAGQPQFSIIGTFDRAFWADGHWFLYQSSAPTGSQPPRSLYRVDLDTQITAGPEGTTAATEAGFEFSSPIQGSTFRCQLDDEGWESCVPGQTYENLSEGPHTFSVAATGPTGPEDGTPATRDWVVDTTAPAAPTLTGTDPSSPANTGAIRVRGLAEAGSTVKLYASNDCEGSPVATGTAAELDSPGLPATVASDATAEFSATATDGVAHGSACSAPLTFVEDSTPPAPPALSGTEPSSPAGEEHPAIRGTAEAGSTITIYESNQCAGEIDATGSSAALSGSGIVTSVTQDLHTQFVATATDAAGNTSGCSNELGYTEVSSPPVADLRADPDVAYTGEQIHLQASSNFGITGYEWDLDGNGSFETDTGDEGTVVRAYPDRGDVDVGLRVTNAIGLKAVDRVPISIRRRPPPGRLGVSINGGAEFTNDRHVTIDAVWPDLAKSMVISNDGGFPDAAQSPVDPEISWTLGSSGSERLPKTVYVRFTGGKSGAETYQDDIILDETAPSLKRVDLKPARRGAKLIVAAIDKTSGVSAMQITGEKNHPGKWKKFKRKRSVADSGSAVFVRVRDRAGNRSRWKSAG